MPTDMQAFVRDLRPETTVLFFGSGSSIPSHAPSAQALISKVSATYSQPSEGLSLAEITELIEQKTKDRRRMIELIQQMFETLRPTGGLLNLSRYEWKAIYTTNYDELIEVVYKTRDTEIIMYSSDFDFTLRGKSSAVRLYKMAPRCFEWAIGASRLSTGPYRNRSWRLPRGSPRIRFRWSKAGLADALPRAMRLKCKRNVPTAPEVRYLGDLAAQRALAAKGWAFGIASPNSDQRTHLRTQVPYPLGIARSPDGFRPANPRQGPSRSRLPRRQFHRTSPRTSTVFNSRSFADHLDIALT